jgi:mRNA interferase MazF
MSSGYVPERGDLVWIDFDPQRGHEQAGRRPAVVLSPGIYNGRVGLALFCPVTSRVKNYPFEVRVPSANPVSGVILTDQVKSLDWRARRAEFLGTLDSEVLAEVFETLLPLIDPDGW